MLLMPHLPLDVAAGTAVCPPGTAQARTARTQPTEERRLMEHPTYEDLTQWCGGRGLPRCLVVGDLVGRELQRVVLHHCNAVGQAYLISNHAHMRFPFCVIDKKLTFATPRVLI